MTKKVTPRGYVVDHKTAHVRYAVSPSNFDSKVHAKVRDLKPWETVAGYTPRRNKKAAASQATAEPKESSPEGTEAPTTRKD